MGLQKEEIITTKVYKKSLRAIKILSALMGVSQVDVIEMAIDPLKKKHKIK